MQFNYQKYGKICIDSTYKINKYSASLTVISGLNNFGKNIIFEMVIIKDEIETTYTWISKNLKLLFPNLPNAFITDEDFSIFSAVLNANNGSSFSNLSFDFYLAYSPKFQKQYSLSSRYTMPTYLIINPPK